MSIPMISYVCHLSYSMGLSLGPTGLTYWQSFHCPKAAWLHCSPVALQVLKELLRLIHHLLRTLPSGILVAGSTSLLGHVHTTKKRKEHVRLEAKQIGHDRGRDAAVSFTPPFLSSSMFSS